MASLRGGACRDAALLHHRPMGHLWGHDRSRRGVGRGATEVPLKCDFYGTVKRLGSEQQ